MNAKDILRRAKRIGVVRTDKLGDMVLTLPMLRAIRDYNPEAEIHIIASSYTEFLLQGQTLIHSYHFIDKTDGGIKSILKSQKFDVLFFPRPRPEEVFPAFLQRVPLRVGSGYRFYSFLYNHRVFEHRKTAEKSEAQYNLDLVNSITGRNAKYELLAPIISDDALSKIDALTEAIGKYIILHPGGGGSAPKWSKENFAQLSLMLSSQEFSQEVSKGFSKEVSQNNSSKKIESSKEINNQRYSVIITGVDYEQEICDYIAKENPAVINMCNKLNLSETAALLQKAECLIVNATGILHIAASLGTKIVALHPSNQALSPVRWGHHNKNNVNLISKKIEGAEDEAELNINIEDVYKSIISLL